MHLPPASPSQPFIPGTVQNLLPFCLVPLPWEGPQPSSLLNRPRDDSRKPHHQRASLQGSRCPVSLPSNLQVGVVQYGEDVVHEFHLNDYRSVKDVVEAASHIEQRGGTETRTAFGIEFAR